MSGTAVNRRRTQRESEVHASVTVVDGEIESEQIAVRTKAVALAVPSAYNGMSRDPSWLVDSSSTCAAGFACTKPNAPSHSRGAQTLRAVVLSSRLISSPPCGRCALAFLSRRLVRAGLEDVIVWKAATTLSMHVTEVLDFGAA